MNEDRFGTPLHLVDELQQHFGPFDLDLAAEPWSAVAPRFITEHMDVFKVLPHCRHGFLNPPYSRGSLDRFMAFARVSVLEKRVRELTAVVPHYSSENWWRKHVERPEGKVLGAEWRYGHIDQVRLWNWKRLISERLIIDIIPIAKRLSFKFPPRYSGARESARFSSVVVRFVHPEAA